MPFRNSFALLTAAALLTACGTADVPQAADVEPDAAEEAQPAEEPRDPDDTQEDAAPPEGPVDESEVVRVQLADDPVTLEPGTHVVELTESGTQVPVHIREETELEATGAEGSDTVNRLRFTRGELDAVIEEVTHVVEYDEDASWRVADLPDDLPSWISTEPAANRYLVRYDLDDFELDGFDTIAFHAHTTDDLDSDEVRRFLMMEVETSYIHRPVLQIPLTFVLMRADDGDDWVSAASTTDEGSS